MFRIKNFLGTSYKKPDMSKLSKTFRRTIHHFIYRNIERWTLYPISSCCSVQYAETAHPRENLNLLYVQYFSAKLVWSNTPKERPNAFSQTSVIIRIEAALSARINSCNATPLHASCPKHSSHFLVKNRITVDQKKAQVLGFYVIYKSRPLLLFKTKSLVKDSRKLSTSREI